MKRLRSPAEEKALSYRKDHINTADDPHQFRREWPLEKARLHRAYRHKVRARLQQISGSITDVPDDPGTDTVRREIVRKWHLQMPLGDHVRERMRLRIQAALGSFLDKPYDAAQHERFAQFLTTQIASDSSYAREQAMFLADLLDGTERFKYPFFPWWSSTWHTWLGQFLADAPEWEPRLRAWIARFDLE